MELYSYAARIKYLEMQLEETLEEKEISKKKTARLRVKVSRLRKAIFGLRQLSLPLD
jgi:ribosomal protein S2